MSAKQLLFRLICSMRATSRTLVSGATAITPVVITFAAFTGAFLLFVLADSVPAMRLPDRLRSEAGRC
jgi:hypothetical protein